jgi:glycosyltransferase involved in cell wall biosynthesis
MDNLKIAWVTRSFLDYRIPVYRELDHLTGNQLFLLYSNDYVPDRVADKVFGVLGRRAIGMTGEWRIGPEDKEFMANRNVSLRIQPGIIRTIRKINPDVLVADGFFKWTFPCLFQRLMHKTPLVVCYERTGFTERRAQWYRTFYRRAAMTAIDAMCCNGRLSGEYVQTLGIPPRRITFGHMVADTAGLAAACEKITDSEKTALKTELGLRGKTVFLYVGRLIPRKGLDLLLNAWAEMNPPAAGLLIVGDGPERGALEAFCAEQGLNNVRFVGNVDYDRIAAYYATADAFVIPTREDNWSLVVPEAMACGLPILCSTYNGCWPELVRENENGWVFDPLDIGDTRRAISRALESENQLPDMGRLSRQIVAQHSPKTAARAILSACRIAASRQNRRQ